MAHTFGTLDVTPATFDEIYRKFKDAAYDHAFTTHNGQPAIDMHGVGLVREHEGAMVGGEILPTTIAQFMHNARVTIARLQEQPNPDTRTITILGDAVRLARELSNAKFGKAGDRQ